MDTKKYSANIFAERLKELRATKGLSQMGLAQATGLSQSAIAKWEMCKTEPTASSLYILSKFFNETTDYLIGLTN
ncbi:MAG TPA: helix-turn-helix transcriptional regulator [Candidatus Coproplasma excrementipullorum]|nr:helix-turn-helix transcriptional regulator [Candidatus Coproplasma excrementipullorum]